MVGTGCHQQVENAGVSMGIWNDMETKIVQTYHITSTFWGIASYTFKAPRLIPVGGDVDTYSRIRIMHKLCHWRLELDDITDLLRVGGPVGVGSLRT